MPMLMPTSILICSLRYGGCGHVGKHTEWKNEPRCEHDYLVCPVCSEDHAFQLTKENFEGLTKGLWSLQLYMAKSLLEEYYSADDDAVVKKQRHV